MIFNKYINKYYKKYILSIIIGVTALIIIAIAQTLMPRIIGNVIDMLEKEKSYDLLKKYIFQILILAIITILGRFLWRYFLLGTARKIQDHLRQDLFNHELKLSPEFYHKHKVGELMSYYNSDIEAIRMAIGPGIMMITDAFFLGVFGIAMLVTQVGISISIAIMLPMILIAFITKIFGKQLITTYTEKQEAIARMSDFVQENFNGIRVIKAFAIEKRKLQEFLKVNKNNKEKNINVVKISSNLHLYIGVLNSLSYVFAVLVAGISVVKNKITLGDFTASIKYIEILSWPVMAVGWCINILNSGKASLDRITKILDEPVVINDALDCIDNKEIKGDIDIKNLEFYYPDDIEKIFPAIDNITVSIKAGMTIGILGETGSGKSTILNILLRLYNVDNNTVFLDNVDIMKIPVKTVRSNINYLLQEPFLFSDTIRNNIALGQHNKDDNKIDEIIKIAGLEKDLEILPEGLDTVIGENGVTLSGGQKQRVALARGIIDDTNILILDDTLSAVDVKTEEIILNHLKKYRQNKTTIIISHRVSTLSVADEIILFKNGKIIDQGSAEYLYENCEYYKEISNKQQSELGN